jgi:hypothetical protein
VNSFNSDDFSQACADFDRITPLDPWKTSVLVKVINSFSLCLSLLTVSFLSLSIFHEQIKRHIPGASGEGDFDLT